MFNAVISPSVRRPAAGYADKTPTCLPNLKRGPAVSLVAYASMEMGEARQSFFTAGLVKHIEPLPTLRYEAETQEDDSSSASDDDLQAAPGVRLRPEILTHDPLTLDRILAYADAESFAEAASCWADLLRLLDEADPSPHFTTLRRFFDARLTPSSSGSVPAEETALSALQLGDDVSSVHTPDSEAPATTVERRSSFVSQARIPPRLRWKRRPSLPVQARDDGSTALPRSRFGSMRGTSRRALEPGAGTEMHELFVLPTHSEIPQSLSFPVRLDLHSVHLAPRLAEGDVPDTNSPQQPAPVDADPHPTSRRSFVHRMFERGARKLSQSSSPAPRPAWMQTEQGPLDPYAPEHAEAIDSDDELEQRRDTSVHSRAYARRSSAGGVAIDLGRVEEDSLFEMDRSVAGVLSVSHEACSGSSARDDEMRGLSSSCNLITLLRKAAHALPSPDEEDAFPAVLLFAMAQAFGWEGMLHLCYGKGSLSAAEQLFSPLGVSADKDSQVKAKYNSLMSWRNQVAQYGDEGNAHSPSEPEPGSFSEADFDAGVDEDPVRLARHVLHRTWSDWHLLFSSLFGWVSEYETTRIRLGLAHEIGREATTSAYKPAPPRSMHGPSVSIAQDAVQAQYGFQRLSGIPEALRDGQNDEHKDFRWARSRLRSSHVQTPLSTSCY